MQTNDPHFRLRLATQPQDLLGAQRLRYKVFVEELGAQASADDHAERLERDDFDPFCDHLVLEDTRRSAEDLDHIVAVYRLMNRAQAQKAGRFYTQSEYDLAPLIAQKANLLELGRSCLHPEYRGGTAMYHMWSGLTEFAAEHQIDLLFGVASFHGTDIAELKHPLSFLHHRHRAPEGLRVRSQAFQSMELLPEDQIDRVAALRATPALIKAYLRLGGMVGDGAYIDRDFNTTDVFLLMDRSRLSARHHAIYSGGHG